MKKKYLYIISIVIILLLIIGYHLIQPNSGKMLCTYSSKENDMIVEMTYEITFKDKMVTNLNAKEVITSSNEKMLKEYKETLDMIYSIYNDIKHYDIEVLIKDKSLITTAAINYKKIKKEDFIEIDSSNQNLYKGDKVPLYKLKNKYKSNGAKCRYI